jgi:hypothetical protein
MANICPQHAAGTCLPVVQNHDRDVSPPNDSVGGPSMPSDTATEADPQVVEGCLGQYAPGFGGGGFSIDGGETFSGDFGGGFGAGGILGGSYSTVECPTAGCTTARWNTMDGGKTYGWQYVQFSAFAGGGSGYYGVYGPGALYFTRNEAGAAALNYYGPSSEQSNADGNRHEYGGNLYVDQNGIYSYTGVLAIGPDCSETAGKCTTGPFSNWVPDGNKIVGDWHTHPWANGSFGGPITSSVAIGNIIIERTDWVGDRAGPTAYPTYVSQPVGTGRGIFVLGPGKGRPVCQLSGLSLADSPLNGILSCH